MSDLIQYLPLSGLRRWERNYRRGNVDAIVASIRAYGFNGILCVRHGKVMAGNHALLSLNVMKDAGDTMPRGLELGVDGDWLVPTQDISHLSDEEAIAFALASNRTQELGGQDDQALASIMQELLDLGLLDGTGYTEDDLTDLMALLEQAGKGEGKDREIAEPRMDEAEKLQAEWGTALGQKWIIPAHNGRGEHRLVCGDCTDARIIQDLMDGDLADLVVTDPPYGVEYVGKTADALQIKNDNLGMDGTRALVRDFLLAAPTRPGTPFYIFSPPGDRETAFRLAILDADQLLRDRKMAGIALHQQLVWVKTNNFVMGRMDYHWRHETILYGWREGNHYYLPDRTQDTVWEEDRPMRSTFHPNMKPLALLERAILNSSKPGQVVFDAFGGSGGTMLAADKNGRLARLCELDPKYAAVILDRCQRSGLTPALSDALPSLPATQERGGKSS